MPSTIQVELVSVERALWSGAATLLVARTPEGEIGVMSGHAPLLAELVPGWIVRIEREDEHDLRVAVHGGFLSVSAQRVSVLAELAELAEDIDVERARIAFARSEQLEGSEAQAARDRALARLRAAEASAGTTAPH